MNQAVVQYKDNVLWKKNGGDLTTIKSNYLNLKFLFKKGRFSILRWYNRGICR